MKVKIYTLLNEATSVFVGASNACKDEKAARELLVVAFRMRNYAVGIRVGAVVIPEKAVEPCSKEIQEAKDAAELATNGRGSSYDRAVVEGYQAIGTLDVATGVERRGSGLLGQ